MSDHPANRSYNPQQALQYLDFAIQFTPQYGDSFLEVIKVCQILKNQHGPAEVDLQRTLQRTK